MITGAGSAQQTTTVTVGGQSYTLNGGGPTTLNGTINGQPVQETRTNGVSTTTVGGVPIVTCGYSACNVSSGLTGGPSQRPGPPTTQSDYAIGHGTADYVVSTTVARIPERPNIPNLPPVSARDAIRNSSVADMVRSAYDTNGQLIDRSQPQFERAYEPPASTNISNPDIIEPDQSLSAIAGWVATGSTTIALVQPETAPVTLPIAAVAEGLSIGLAPDVESGAVGLADHFANPLDPLPVPYWGTVVGTLKPEEAKLPSSVYVNYRREPKLDKDRLQHRIGLGTRIMLRCKILRKAPPAPSPLTRP